MRRGSIVVIALLAACTQAAPPPTTTLAPTTTATTTTTTLPPLQVRVHGAPPGLVEVVIELYAWAMDTTAGPPPPIPQGLAENLSSQAPTDHLALDGLAWVEEVMGGWLAVVVAHEDVVIAIDEGDGWRVVGARLASLGSAGWYGPSPRMVLVIGSDARPGQSPPQMRADSLHILTASPERDAGAIVGIPRDSWVVSPGGGRSKFTDVMPRYGPEGVLDTARRLTDLPLEGYLITGFAGFVDLVNAFGGVNVEVPLRMSDRASGAYFEPGEQYLHGWAALAFARNRHLPGGDFTRSFHQGLLIRAGMLKVQGNGIQNMPSFLRILTTFASTDLTLEDLVTLAATTYLLDPERVPNMVVPGSVGTVGRASVVFLGGGATAVFADLADGALD